MQFSEFYFVKANKIWHDKSKREEWKRLFIENERFNKNDVGSMSNENWTKSHILVHKIVTDFICELFHFINILQFKNWKPHVTLFNFNNTKFFFIVHSQWNFQFQDKMKCLCYVCIMHCIRRFHYKKKETLSIYNFKILLLRFENIKEECYGVTVQNFLWEWNSVAFDILWTLERISVHFTFLFIIKHFKTITRPIHHPTKQCMNFSSV